MKKNKKHIRLSFYLSVFLLLTVSAYLLKVQSNKANQTNGNLLVNVVNQRYQGNANMPEQLYVEISEPTTTNSMIALAEKISQKKSQGITITAERLLDVSFLDEDQAGRFDQARVNATGEATKLEISRFYAGGLSLNVPFTDQLILKNELNLVTGQLELVINQLDPENKLQLQQWARGFSNAFFKENTNAGIQTVKLVIYSTIGEYTYNSACPAKLTEVKTISR